jgi:hypothetical protein
LSDVPDKDVCTGFHFLEWSVGLTYWPSKNLIASKPRKWGGFDPKSGRSFVQERKEENNWIVEILLRDSPVWALASITIRLQASRTLALSRHSFSPIFLRSVDTSSSHLVFGLALRLVEQHGLNIPRAKCQVRDSRLLSPSSFIHYVPRLLVSFHNK